MKQSCKHCAWLETCIDPCSEECPNMQVLDSKGELIEGKDYCDFEQGSEECQSIIGKVCTSFQLPTKETEKCVEKFKRDTS